jgi:hypothetical protein
MSDFFEEAPIISVYGPGDAVADGILAVGEDSLHDSVAGLSQSFPLGTIVYTPGAADVAERAGAGAVDTFVVVLERYARCDWGDVPSEDADANTAALEHNERLLGSYTIGGKPVWVITEADRSLTTILTPDEY